MKLVLVNYMYCSDSNHVVAHKMACSRYGPITEGACSVKVIIVWEIGRLIFFIREIWDPVPCGELSGFTRWPAPVILNG